MKQRLMANWKTALAVLLVVVLAILAWSLSARRSKAETTASLTLPAGYRVEAYVTGLNYPIAVTWDESGAMYVAEAGTDTGRSGTPAPNASAAAGDGARAGRKGVGPGRILRVGPQGKTVVATGLNFPTTDVKIKDGKMFVAHRGCLSVFENNVRTDLIQGLPSGDHFTGEIAFDRDGWVYLGNGTVTNSGVVDPDSFTRWADSDARSHDIPARDITLAGVNYESRNPRTLNPFDKATTGAFMPFGVASTVGQEVKGRTHASGVILRVKPDSSNLEVYAWGFRNPFGLGFAPDGRLIAIDQGYDDRGVRPVANAPDPIYVVEKDSWYGWPDYAGGTPITDQKFRSRSAKAPVTFLMKEHPALSQPLAVLKPNTGAMRFDFAPPVFDTARRMYIAVTGSANPLGIEDEPSTKQPRRLPGVLAFDPKTGKTEDFARNKSLFPAGRSLSGFNTPVDVKFGPDGSMYVVDFGVFQKSDGIPNAVPNTGVIWKISKQRSEYQKFKDGTMPAPDPQCQWDPDYSKLRARLVEFISGLGQEWGIYFKDLTSGKTFGINEYLEVPAASTVKVPVVLYASHLVARGQLSWNERLTYYSARDWRGGAGTLQYTAKDGDTFSIRELAEKAIRESDNVAWKMLERRLGLENIIEFMRQIGGETVYPGGQNISTPRDNAVYMEAALEFSKVSREGEKLMFDLANTIWNTGLNRYIWETTVAHKEGDIMGVADDVGVIYFYRPYILSIMSKGHEDVEAGFEKIGRISRMIFDYQVSLYNR